MCGPALFVFTANLVELCRQSRQGTLLVGQAVADFAVTGFGGLQFLLRSLPQIGQIAGPIAQRLQLGAMPGRLALQITRANSFMLDRGFNGRRSLTIIG